jgi:hypothetical protein
MDCTFCTKKADNIEVDSTSKIGSQFLKMDIFASLIQCTLLIIKEGSLSSYVRKLEKETRVTHTVHEAMFSPLL